MTGTITITFKKSPEEINRLNELFSDNRPARIVTRLREFYEGFDLNLKYHI